jgi:prepilin-type N-terminal cleavage/methylation domain-containing protein
MTHKWRGFTLIELLISVAIIGILTTIVVLKYKSFDSTVLLKSAAYEAALTLRESQIKSMSAVRGTNSFDFPRGVAFTRGSQTYLAFIFNSTLATEYPRYDKTDPDPDYATSLATTTIGRSVQVSDLCITTGVGETCGLTRLDISYKRPEFKAIFYVPTNTEAQNKLISSAKIKFNSANNPTNVFVVTVSQLGQISVGKQ